MISPEMLRRYPFFHSLSHEQINRLAMISSGVEFAAGEWILREGEPPDRLYLIVEGDVDICLQVGGTAQDVLAFTTVTSGAVLGWSALIAERRFASARARTPVSAIAMDGARLLALCEEDEALGYRIMRRIAGVIYERLRNVTYQLVSLIPTAGS